jgi:hypothetical protein
MTTNKCQPNHSPFFRIQEILVLTFARKPAVALKILHGFPQTTSFQIPFKSYVTRHPTIGYYITYTVEKRSL